MNPKKLAVIATVLLATSATAGCFGPGEGPVTTIEDTETTPGEDTVEAGATPQGEPVNDTAIAEGGTTELDDGNGEEEGGDTDDETEEADG